MKKLTYGVQAYLVTLLQYNTPPSSHVSYGELFTGLIKEAFKVLNSILFGWTFRNLISRVKYFYAIKVLHEFMDFF